jgi:hypothetical protein
MSLLAALVLASVHVFSQRLRVLDGIPRSRLLSAAGGTAVVFVFLQLLPAVARGDQELRSALGLQARQGAASGLFSEHLAFVVEP